MLNDFIMITYFFFFLSINSTNGSQNVKRETAGKDSAFDLGEMRPRSNSYNVIRLG